jgi:hypothetical protein
MSALNHIATASNAEFSGRVMMLMFKVAQAVATEDPGTADHAQRLAYANHVIIGGEQPQLAAAHVISSNPTIGATIDSDPALLGANVPDGDIEFALASIWTARSIAYASTI